MQLIRIFNVEELKIGDKIAIASSDKSLIDSIGSNINLVTGKVVEKNFASVLVLTDSTRMMISNILLKVQAAYLMIDETKIKNCFNSNEINLERKLRKAEKLNRRYEAILTKKFNVTKEELKTNFKEKRKTNKNDFKEYKVMHRDIPYIFNNEYVTLPVEIRFKRNSKNHIMCEYTINSNVYCLYLRTQGIAICHKDDEFNQEIGELIATTKAMKEATCRLY